MISDDELRAMMFEASTKHEEVIVVLARVALGATTEAILEGGYAFEATKLALKLDVEVGARVACTVVQMLCAEHT